MHFREEGQGKIRETAVAKVDGRRRWRLGATAVAVLAAALLSPGCSVNPATGKSQLMLISEQQELAMGREADPQIVAAYGLYDDPEIQEYIQSLGDELAAKSERPDIEWHFKVLDDPVVNAFALPGGYIYITRGILAHLNSEVELAAVLGHEIGHVVARHSANQMSKQQMAAIGLTVGSLFLEGDEQIYGALAGMTAQMMLLKFGRDDERQSDDLGLRYIQRAGYDPRTMSDVFETLGRVSEAAGGQRMPKWASTHPSPENRVGRLETAIASLNTDFAGRKVGTEVFLGKVDGMMFGQNPREGYFIGNAFYHPELRLKLDFPEGWQVSNQRSSVGAVSGEQDAMMVLTLANAESLEDAEEGFYEQAQISPGRRWSPRLRGLSAIGSEFEASGGEQTGDLRGRVAFVEYGDNIYQLLTLSKGLRWSKYQRLLGQAVGSFSRLSDRRYLDVQPKRVEVVTLDRAMTLREFHRRYPSTVDLSYLAIVNHAEEDTHFERGARVKRVVGGELPEGVRGEEL